MKKILVIAAVLTFNAALAQQEVSKHLAEARTAYAAGKLDDSRFAMQQAMQELDILTGKEVLKILPAKMLDENARMERDNVTGASGFFGVMIHREYGIDQKKLPAKLGYLS